ncbi:hypothetical protein NUW54_g11723 [Trametes sanguinea]|uniref:Uncharacterized protein n=1 Tax=Trametes sanguinea TaxID=158606 RepID=A0ACC1N8B2_9APHY|nr:hypothetical protein NUW54_g11723 [Trametes sanguinea]
MQDNLAAVESQLGRPTSSASYASYASPALTSMRSGTPASFDADAPAEAPPLLERLSTPPPSQSLLQRLGSPAPSSPPLPRSVYSRGSSPSRETSAGSTSWDCRRLFASLKIEPRLPGFLCFGVSGITGLEEEELGEELADGSTIDFERSRDCF